MGKMSREELAAMIKEVICDCLPDVNAANLNDESVINTDAGIDSMGFTLVMCKLEAKLDVKIPQRKWNKLRSLGDVIDAFHDQMR